MNLACALADDGRDEVGTNANDGGGTEDFADRIGSGINAGNHDVRESLVERTVVPETGFAAANATVARADGEGNAVVPFEVGAGIVGCWTAATHFVEAPALASAVVVPGLDELAGIEEGAAVAFIVNALAIEHLRAADAIKFGQGVEGEDVGEDAGHDLGDGRAAGHIDDGLVRDELVDGHRARGIGMSGLDAAVGSAGAPCDDGLGVFGGLLEDVEERVAADGAIDAAVLGGSIAFHGKEIAAGVIFDELLANCFDLEAGSRLKGIVVIEGDHVEDDVLGDGVGGANKGFAATSALEAMEPDDGDARLGLHRGDDRGNHGGFQPHRRGGGHAEAEKVPAIDAMLTQDIISGQRR